MSTKITIKEAQEIRKLYKIGEFTQKELGLKYNLDQTTISDIIRNNIWKEGEMK